MCINVNDTMQKSNNPFDIGADSAKEKNKTKLQIVSCVGLFKVPPKYRQVLLYYLNEIM